MSVGGVIVDIVPVKVDRIWVNTWDGRTLCAVYVDPGKERIEVGDSLWWQGRKALWTPRAYRAKPDGRQDVPLKRIGYSGAPHPHAQPKDQRKEKPA